MSRPVTSRTYRFDDRDSRGASGGIASAVIILTRSTPGSPWMPMPSSSSSSAIVKVGRPTAGMVQGARATPIDPEFETTVSAALLTSASVVAAPRPPSAMAPAIFSTKDGGPDSSPLVLVLDGDVVVNQDVLRGDLGSPRLPLGKAEVQDVSPVIREDDEHSEASVARPGSRSRMSPVPGAEKTSPMATASSIPRPT